MCILENQVVEESCLLGRISLLLVCLLVMSLWLQPPKGTYDRFPEEYAVRKYIFDMRRKLCLSFGYEEYLWPLVEHADIWRAKSGEDVGWSELTLITDREGKISDLALRPEMTPTVTRMVARNFPSMSKPVRWFSIANFYRNERPQRGRNREFRQLNVDMFGETAQTAELEILQMALELMFAFKAPDNSFVLKINHRHLIDSFLLQIVELTNEQKLQMIRLMDKREKLPRDAFVKSAEEQWLTSEQIEQVVQFLSAIHLEELITQFPLLASFSSIQEIDTILSMLWELWYNERISFSPSLMRGFDYYDWLVFEVFDKHPDNNRAMFGWGRYNGLASIFGSKEEIPAIGFAPGDEPMRLFLESRWLLDTIRQSQQLVTYIQVLDEEVFSHAYKLAMLLRKQWITVEVSTQIKKTQKAFEYAEKKCYTAVIFLWRNEVEKWSCIVKNILTGEESPLSL